MGYDKQTFTDGQVLKAQDLNKMSEGIAASKPKKPYTSKWERFKVQVNQTPLPAWNTSLMNTSRDLSDINSIVEGTSDFNITKEDSVVSQMTWTKGSQMIAMSSNEYFGQPHASSSGRQYSNNVSIPGGYTHLVLTMLASSDPASTGGLVFFDSSDNPIKGYYINNAAANGVAEKTYKIPANAAYFVTTIWTSDSNTFPYNISNYKCCLAIGTGSSGTAITDTSNNDVQNFATVTGVIALPRTYTPDGPATKLIMFAHGGHGFVDDTRWYPTKGESFTAFIQSLLDEGYAVFDCNGYKDIPYEEWKSTLIDRGDVQISEGMPQVVEAYYKCYQYIIENYNIKPGCYIQGCSQGGHLAINFAYTHRECVSAIAMMAGQIDLYDQGYNYQTLENKRQVAKLLGFTNTTFTTNQEAMAAYEHHKADPFDPMKRITTIDGVDYVLGWNIPIKFFYGTNDTILPQYEYTKRLVKALQNSKAICYLRWFNGFSHDDVAVCNKEVARKEMIAWFNRF